MQGHLPQAGATVWTTRREMTDPAVHRGPNWEGLLLALLGPPNWARSSPGGAFQRQWETTWVFWGAYILNEGNLPDFPPGYLL